MAHDDGLVLRELPFWHFPSTLCVGGRIIPIRTDFRVGIRLRELWGERYYLHRQRLLFMKTAELLAADEAGAAAMLRDPEDMAEAVLWYLMDGRVDRKTLSNRLARQNTVMSHTDTEKRSEGLFSYKWDMPLLYASFLAVYQMDLLKCGYLHLWQFDALFYALPRDCALMQKMEWRKFDLSEIKDDGMRAQAAAEKVRCRIPSDDKLIQMCNDTHLCETINMEG